jgi:aminopeptidase YwaD
MLLIMKKQLFSVLLLISLFTSVSAQGAKPDPAEERLRKHVSYLASDRLEGRRTGEVGATYAAGYIANQFAGYRLKGGFIQKTRASFLQPFPFVNETQTSANNRLMVTTPASNQLFNVKERWLPFSASPNIDLPSTSAVFAGYGISSTNPQRDDYAGMDAKGKVVYAFDGVPGDNNPQNPFTYFDAHAKAQIAKERGAVALVLISREQNFENDRLALAKYDVALGETAVPVAIVSRAVGAIMLGVSEADLRNWETNPPATRDVRVLLKIDLERKGAETYNVIGILEGIDPVLRNEAIVIGAHYDHLGRGGRGSLAPNSKEIHNGADDNASGVAALLELARQFSQEKKNKRTIIFIAFGGAEEGLIGSKFYVNNPVFPLNKTVAMINMDGIGRLRENKLTVGGIGTASEWKSLVEMKNNQIKGDINITPIVTPDMKNIEGIVGKATNVFSTTPFSLQFNEDGLAASDHLSFYEKKIPVLFFFTGAHADYHRPSDTAEKIYYAGLRQVTAFVSEIVRSIDLNPKRPTYTAAKS